MARWVALNLRVDPEKKTWSLKSDPMTDQEFVNRYYDDISAIFKSKPETFVVSETHHGDGTFKSFTASTI